MMRLVVDPNSDCNMAILGGNGYCPYCCYFGKKPIVQIGQPEFCSLDTWAKILNKFEAGLIEFGLGEPLRSTMIYELINKVNKKHKWAITTNGLNDPILSLFHDSPPKNFAYWTFSLHPHSTKSMRETLKKAIIFKQVYGAVSINIVDWKDNIERCKPILHATGQNGIPVNILSVIPKLQGKGPKLLSCKQGQDYILIHPNGNVYGCHTRRFMDYPFGNVFDPDFQLPRERTICDLPCMPYYLGDKNPCKEGVTSLDIREEVSVEQER